jgi:DNA-binding XRE family transcriptional regulator
MEAAKKYLEVFKKIPLASFEKVLVNASRNDKKGIEIISIYEVEKGKYDEAFNLAYRRMHEFYGIEGFTWRIQTLAKFEESFAIMGLTPPK